MRYEEAAERRTLTGWCCKTCNRYHGNGPSAEHSARWCCADDFPCPECGGRKERPYTCCANCRSRHEAERWAARERRPWDGVQMLYSDTDDCYFRDFDEALDHLACDDEDERRTLDDLRLILCEPNRAREFIASEFVSDDLPGDEDAPDYPEIDATVNALLQGLGVLSWTPGKYAADLTGLPQRPE